MKRVAVLGLEYIGLPTAILAAECGYEVFGVDADENIVSRINRGDLPFSEPRIKDRLRHALSNAFLHISTTVHYADCFIIAVPTHLTKQEDGADLSDVFDAVSKIAPVLGPGNAVIIESTVPLGTTEKIASYLEELTNLSVGKDFFVIYAPGHEEAGNVFETLVARDRIIGGITPQGCDVAYTFYSQFVTGELRIIDARTAEMIRLVQSGFRFLQSAFAHQVTYLCRAANIDPYLVIDIANRNPAVSIIAPSCGIQSPYSAIDSKFLVQQFPDDTQLLQVAEAINKRKPYQVLERIMCKVDEIRGDEKSIRVLVLGATAKPNTSNVQNSPALTIIFELAKKRDMISLAVYDPHVLEGFLRQHDLTYVSDVQQAIKGADLVVILVKHDAFVHLADKELSTKTVLDACGLLYDSEKRYAEDMLKGAFNDKAVVEKRIF